MKKQERDFIMYLEDIFECTKRIRTWTSKMTYQEFSNDRKTQDAVIMNIGIIGEATKNLPTKIKQAYKEMDWKKLVDMRNILIHEYFGANLKRIWRIIQEEIPGIQEKISYILVEELKNEKLL